jgi:hypothetical protein
MLVERYQRLVWGTNATSRLESVISVERESMKSVLGSVSVPKSILRRGFPFIGRAR